MPCSRWCYRCGYAHEDMEICPYEQEEQRIRDSVRASFEDKLAAKNKEIRRLKRELRKRDKV